MNAAFFDFDGTLFDTRADLVTIVNHTRCELGLKELPVDVVISHVGQGARYLLEHSITETNKSFEELWAVFASHYAEHCCEALVPYPHLRETLEELRHRGWKLGINTNKPDFAVKMILKKFDLELFFGEAIVAGGMGITLKPDPISIRACADKMGHTLNADDWMIGDSWTDIECAARAGVKSAFCTFGLGKLKTIKPTVNVASFDELLNYLKAHA